MKWLINNELAGTRKEVIVAQFEILSLNLRGETEENCEESHSRYTSPLVSITQDKQQALAGVQKSNR
jgi:hypothetical protein